MSAETNAGERAVRPGRAIAVISLALVLAVPIAVWPALTLVSLAVAGILFLARARPGHALVGAICLFMFEGSVKVLLTNTALPVEVSPLAVGAALVDLALFGAVLGVVARARPADFRSLARAAPRPVLLAGAFFAAWLLLSAIQVFTSPSITDALEGVRLTHAYLLLVPAAYLAFRDPADRDGLLRLLLAGLAAVMLYATLRGIVGPDPAEEAAALAREGATRVGGAFRGVGTFSSAVGLSSAAAPAAVFGLVLGVLSRRHRSAALTLAAVAFGAVVASLGRTPLLATLLGLAFAGLFVARIRLPRRRRLTVLGGMAGAAALLALGAVIASAASPVLQDRLGGLVRPWQDRSMEMRYETWEKELERVEDEPLGRGLGTVGRASGFSRDEKVTTDNSFLKVLVEQGYPGLALLLLALLTTIVVLVRSIGRSRRADRALGVAALSAFVSFAALMATIEAIEQPGKVLAWTFLGIAIAAVRPLDGAAASPPAPLSRLRAAARAESRGRRALWAGGGVALTLTALAITLPRQPHFTAVAFVVPTPAAPFPARPDAHFLRQLFEDHGIQVRLVRSTGSTGLQRPYAIEMRDGAHAPGSFVRVESDDPDRSVRVLDAVVGELRAASSRHLGGLARDRLSIVRFFASRGGDPPLAARLEALAADPPPQIAVAWRSERPAPSRSVDRLLDALPGPYPRRPDPLELGSALPVAVLCAWLFALALLPPRRAAPT